jgi:hypothetical protein
LLEDELTGDLNGSGHCTNGSARLPSDTHGSRDQLTAQRHIQELEGPAEKGQITGGENETNHGSIGNGSRTRLFPLSRSKTGQEKENRGLKSQDGTREDSRSTSYTTASGSLHDNQHLLQFHLSASVRDREHVRVNGWPLLVVVEGVTRAFFRSRNSLEVLEASALRLSTTGPRKSKY